MPSTLITWSSRPSSPALRTAMPSISGLAVAQDAGDDAAVLQGLQHLAVLGEGAQVAVLVHQLRGAAS
jgi:hypothetical protein